MFRTFFALVLWLACVPALATPSRVTGWMADPYSSSLTVSLTTGDALCVYVATSSGNSAAATVSDNASGGSNTYTNASAASVGFGGGAGWTYSFYALNVNAATSLTATVTGETV